MTRILSAATEPQPAANGRSEQKHVVSTPDAPEAIGPYSQAIKVGELVFASGQIPLDPGTGQIVGSDSATQADRVLKNLQAVLLASGTSLENVVKTAAYLGFPRSQRSLWPLFQKQSTRPVNRAGG